MGENTVFEFLAAVLLKAFGFVIAILLILVLGFFDPGHKKPTKQKEDDADTKWKKWRVEREKERNK